MGIRSSATGAAYGRFQQRAHGKLNHALEDVLYDMEDVMEDGANEMRHGIETRGVHNTVENYDGRIKTSTMYDAVDHEVYRQGDLVHGRFGWLPGRPREKYFGWQEDGTLDHGDPVGDPDPRERDERTPRGIRPMYALRDASEHATEELARRFGRAR